MHQTANLDATAPCEGAEPLPPITSASRLTHPRLHRRPSSADPAAATHPGHSIGFSRRPGPLQREVRRLRSGRLGRRFRLRPPGVLSRVAATRGNPRVGLMLRIRCLLARHRARSRVIRTPTSQPAEQATDRTSYFSREGKPDRRGKRGGKQGRQTSAIQRNAKREAQRDEAPESPRADAITTSDDSGRDAEKKPEETSHIDERRIVHNPIRSEDRRVSPGGRSWRGEG